MGSNRRMKVVRTLVIEGDEKWVLNVLDHCYVNPGTHGKIVFPGGNSLTETSRYSECTERTTWEES